MLKIRFKRYGRKKQPFYRIVVMNTKTKRDGKVIEELGFYNPSNKNFQIDRTRTIIRLDNGAKPTQVLRNLLIQSQIF